MVSPFLLEDVYNITNNGYRTGSERFDGFIIGLATMLFIRNAELVVIDLLTTFFGDRKQKVSFRVLRTWQMLNLNSIASLVTGFDSDIPCSRFQFLRRLFKPGTTARTCRFKVSKGTFTSLLFVMVLCGKLLILTAEVAIIAFLIPTDTLHRDPGGLALIWRDRNISESELQGLETCMFMTNSYFLSDFSQLALCKRESELPSFGLAPQNWSSNEVLRMARTVIPLDSFKAAGAAVEDGRISCLEAEDPDPFGLPQEGQRSTLARQVGLDFGPIGEFQNHYRTGEITVRGTGIVMGEDGFFHNGDSGVTAIFTSTEGMLQLSFLDWIDKNEKDISATLPTVNGKLFMAYNGSVPGQDDFLLCPQALYEIIRVTGTLSADLLVDMLRLTTEVVRESQFSVPTSNANRVSSVRGFNVGVSRKFSIDPNWIVLAAAISVLLSVVTGRLNQTEVIMGRVYREHNFMECACSPVFIDEEKCLEAGLYKSNLKYRWGRKPDDEWAEVEGMKFSEDALLT